MLSTADIERARYHMGYMTVTVASSFAFGIPQATETQWMFEDAIKRVLPESEFRVIKILDRLDCIEDKLGEVPADLFAESVGDLRPNLNQGDALEREYARWGMRLADMLGVVIYPYANRFKAAMASGAKAGNISVRR